MDRMDPSTAQNHETLENMLVCSKTQQEKKPRPGDEQALKCPRCESTNTKFCYYNNYSLTQPRYFCKSCRRYWTKGGTLRNIPVGGGCRKNKRSSPSSSSSSPSKKGQDQPLITINHNHPFSNFSPLPYDPTDLSLAFARLQGQTNGHLGFDAHHPHVSMLGNPSNTQYCNIASSGHGFLETQNGFHNVYYGVGNGDQNGGMGANFGDDQMGILTYEDSGATTVKQECFNGGYPWQLGGDGNMGGDHVDSGRQYSWNGVGSSWHGLLHSPLM